MKKNYKNNSTCCKRFAAVLLLLTAFIFNTVSAQFAQQGGKLVGTGTSTTSVYQGTSVSVSSDGNTAIVGGFSDANDTGAAWVFTRTAGVWSQQGSKLVGTGSFGGGAQGHSVSLSADGNTALVGGYADHFNAGAAWIYTRTGGVWSQSGTKLVGSGATGSALQGYASAISADGTTAIIGGYQDNSMAGAVWIFIDSVGTWVQQGSKLVGTGAVGAGWQGWSVSISSDGNTALVGGYTDNTNAGAAWVFTRSGGVWTQQGNKLVGTGATGAAAQGYSVALSPDGNTALVGGYDDNTLVGATWVYTRTGGVWTQQGSKLVGTGGLNHSGQGTSVSTSYSGDTAIIGGYSDAFDVGAIWVFTRAAGVWTQQGNKLVGTGAVGTAWQGQSVSLSSDGHTGIVGGYKDNGGIGAAWVYYNASSGIDEINNGQASITVYPNPASSLLTIRNLRFMIYDLRINDIMGREVYHQPINNSTQSTINLTQWSNGVYFYQLRNGMGTVQGKFVVDK